MRHSGARREIRHRRLRLGTFCLAVFLSTAAFSLPGHTQSLLARATPGGVVAVDLDRVVSPTELRVELNGQNLPGPHILRGGQLLITLPDRLEGVRHDLRVFGPGTERNSELGRWILETETRERLTFGSISADTGVRTTEDGTEAFATGTVRLEFDEGQGQRRGRLVVSRAPGAGENGSDELTVDDLFLEFRSTAFRRDGFLRLGNSVTESFTHLIDAQSRRGVSFRLADTDGARDLTFFAQQASTSTRPGNLLGLGNADNRVAGVAGVWRPRTLPGARVDLAAYKGRASNLPSGGHGPVEAVAAAVQVPVAAGRADLGFKFAESSWRDSGAAQSTNGRALETSLAWQLSPPGDSTSLQIGVRASQIDLGFYAPLNPDLIRGETGAAVFLEYIDPTWQWQLDLSTYETGTGGSAADPIDRLNGVAFSLLYDPGDFTGGFLNGALFFLNAGVEWQDRQRTPSGAPAPEDNTLARLSFGMQKTQPRYTWAWSVSHSDLDDRSARGTAERGTFLTTQASFDPTPERSARAFLRAGQRRTTAGTYDEVEASMSFVQSIDNRLWEYEFRGGLQYTEDPSRTEGEFALVGVSRRVTEHVRLMAEAAWGRDALVPQDVTGEGWSLSVFLRTDLGFTGR